MEISKEKFLNQWIEFSGGIRPSSNMIMFEEGDYPRFHLRYVFDWETSETITMSFELYEEEIEYLLDEITTKQYARISKEGDQKLLFEWKLLDDTVLIRIDAEGYSGLQGKLRYFLKDFRQLIFA